MGEEAGWGRSTLLVGSHVHLAIVGQKGHGRQRAAHGLRQRVFKRAVEIMDVLKRAREVAPAPAPAPAPPAAPAPFRGPAADSPVGELLLDAIGIVSSVGFSVDVARARALCGVTWRRGDRGATNDMLVQSLRLRVPWLAAARAAEREAFEGAERTTHLMRAAAAGDELRVRELLALGADPNLADADGKTALAWAAWRGGRERECVGAALLAGGAAVDLADCEGRTPLMQAATFGHAGFARLLLANGARQELQSKASTALHVAVSFDHPGVVDALLAHPDSAAALALRNDRGRTPLQYALWCGGRAGIIAALRVHGTLG